MKKNIAALARKIKLIAMDIDGVLTAGEMIILNSGEEIKIWDVKDRLGFHLIRRSGADIKFAWITGRGCEQVEKRANEIGIDFLYQECMNKMDAVMEIMNKTGLKPGEIAYIGDDLVDVPVLKNVGLAVCPSDAPAELKREADYVSKIAGGRGVFREIAEIVLKSQGYWKKATKDFI
ncbi:MAG: HAD hydrolase family protein [Elusimicrobiota bacterium]